MPRGGRPEPASSTVTEPYYDHSGLVGYNSSYGTAVRMRLWGTHNGDCSWRTEALCLGTQSPHSQEDRAAPTTHSRRAAAVLGEQAQAIPPRVYLHGFLWIRPREGGSRHWSVETPARSSDGGTDRTPLREGRDCSPHQWSADRQQTREPIPLPLARSSHGSRAFASAGVQRTAGGWSSPLQSGSGLL